MNLPTTDLEAAKTMFRLQHNDDPPTAAEDNDTGAKKADVETKETIEATTDAEDKATEKTFDENLRQEQQEPPSDETKEEASSDHEPSTRSPPRIDTTTSPTMHCGTVLTMSPVTIRKKRSRSPISNSPDHHKKSKTFFIGNAVKNPTPNSRGKTLETFAQWAAAKREAASEETRKEEAVKKEEPAKEAAETPLVESPKNPVPESRSDASIPVNPRRHKAKVSFVDLSQDPSDDEKEPQRPPHPVRVGLHSDEMKLVHAIVRKLTGRAQQTFKAIAAKAIARHRMGIAGYHNLPNAILRKVQRHMPPTEYMGAYVAVRNELRAAPSARMRSVKKRAYANGQPKQPPMQYAMPGNGTTTYAACPPKQHIPPYGTIVVQRPYESSLNYPTARHSPAPTYNVPIMNHPSSTLHHHDSTPTLVQPPHGATTLEPPMYEEPLSQTVGLPTTFDGADTPEPQSSPSPDTVPATKTSNTTAAPKTTQGNMSCEAKVAPKKISEAKAATKKTSEAKAATKKTAETNAAPKKTSEAKTAPKKTAETKAAPKKTAETKAAPKKASEAKAAPKKTSETTKTVLKVTKKTTPKAAAKPPTKTAAKKRTKLKELDLTIPSKEELQKEAKPDLQLALRYGYALCLKHGRSLPIPEILEQAEIKLEGMTTAERDALSTNITDYFAE